MNARTDLALESVNAAKISEGITKTERGKAFKITEIKIAEDKHGEKIGKKKGRYITLEGSPLSNFSDEFKNMCTEFSEELSQFIPDGRVLAVGLGNNDITPDALGPQAAAKILATRHLREELGDEDEFLSGLRPVGVLASGVLGQTGIETAELIEGLMEKINPSAIIAIDALACSDVNRLGKTIQLSDAGISPGSGVQNKRHELSQDTLGVPVIAVGVPTVVDMHTIVEDYTGKAVNTDLPNMMVTPRDIDRLIERSAAMIAAGINMALHPQLSFEDIEAIMY
ncbi:GPR endopeptidase [Porcipelethomonas sp.]|uniref:GPR endopeptidase n=1 Tax=Porcipelethomonas sp. TaxID=2981675 RepID=UPI003EF41E80